MPTSTESVRAQESASVELPENVSLSLSGNRLTARGPLGTIDRPFPSGGLSIDVDGRNVKLTLRVPPNRRRSKSLLHTWEAHLRNLAQGVTVGFQARLKVVAAHFPMRVSVKGEELLIENFLGEKYPRTASLVPGVKARVDGEFVVLEGIDVEQVGRCAASVERTTRIRDYDPRVFQDGIYLIERARPKEA